MRSERRRWTIPLALCLTAAAVPALPGEARAFCGFYVGGADQKLFNNATMVVMMREGTRTVLAMQNNYEGPPANFAMVVPVPIVLQKENVKTLPREIFAHVDTLAAPRLVEYWEQDPCPAPGDDQEYDFAPKAAPAGMAMATEAVKDHGVRIEAQFTVGEYEVVVLSAQDSMGLDTWLRENKYRIPDGAEPILRPYVQSGMKFFVAKVNVGKVQFDKGMAMLSPLRFHYDTDTFTLPVRLGLLNSQGTQDLIVHILSRGKRYEVANYPNVPIPTNYDVAEAARGQFGAFYASLFDKTLEKNRGAVITEYSWDASSCDPCPTPALDPGELATLGADVLRGPNGQEIDPYGFVLTRLHARYGKDALGQDLVFKEARPIEGGRESYGVDRQEHGARPSSTNNFQGRYAIRHPWRGPINCPEPKRGVWGGPPEGVEGSTAPRPALDLAFAPRGGVELASFIREPIPELQIAGPARYPGVGEDPFGIPPGARGCGSCAVGSAPDALFPCSVAALLALLANERRRRR